MRRTAVPPEGAADLVPAFALSDLLTERACRGPLEPIDLRSLAYLSRRLSASTLAECELQELARAVYGRQPGGSDRRAIDRSVERLAEAVAILDGWDLTAGSRQVGRTRAPLFHAIAEGPRGSLRFEFSPWLAAAIAAEHFPRLELSVKRALSPTSERLLACLETVKAGVPQPGGVERLAIRLDEDLYARLALRYRRAHDARRHLLEAAEQIAQVDRRYVSVSIRRRRFGWLLCVERTAGGA